MAFRGYERAINDAYIVQTCYRPCCTGTDGMSQPVLASQSGVGSATSMRAHCELGLSSYSARVTWYLCVSGARMYAMGFHYDVHGGYLQNIGC